MKSRWKLGCAALLGVVLAGCFPEKRIFWSPDGKTAAVIANERLYFCDGAGALTPPLLSNAMTVAWLGNAQDLVVELKFPAQSWPDLTNLVSQTTVTEVAETARRLLPQLKQGAKADELLQDYARSNGDGFVSAVKIYWRDCHSEEVFDLQAKEAEELEKERSADVIVLQRMTYQDGQLVPGRELSRNFDPALELRPSPQGKLLAYATSAGLVVTPVDGSAPPRLLDGSTVAMFFDWTPDGRSLVYIKTAYEKNKRDVTLGVLARRRICNEEGMLEPAEECEDLAGLLFDEASKVRCMRDGRILFTSLPLQLPATGKEMPQREQLFALDPARYHSAIRLIPNSAEEQMPKKLATFEISPDDKRISTLLDNGGVAVFNLDSGTVDTVQADQADVKSQLIPSWKSADELCYGSIADVGKTNQLYLLEVALWKNGKTRSISAQWPTNMTAKLFDSDDAAKPNPHRTRVEEPAE